MGSISTVTINQFESMFQKVIILTAFIPMIMNTGGNAGNQSIAIITRAIATKELSLKDSRFILKKELLTASLMSFITASFAFLWIFALLALHIVRYESVFGGDSISWLLDIARVSGLVSLTLLIAVFLAKLLGSFLPLLAIRFKKNQP